LNAESVSNPEVITVESGTAWKSIVTNATQGLVKRIPPTKLPREFEAPVELPGAPVIHMVRIRASDGMLRAAFRLIDQTA
jgi:hypothetical protein